jgi:hypothetical protein
MLSLAEGSAGSIRISGLSVSKPDYFGTIHGFKFPWSSDGYLGGFASG